jgi:hypothetical protein
MTPFNVTRRCNAVSSSNGAVAPSPISGCASGRVPWHDVFRYLKGAVAPFAVKRCTRPHARRVCMWARHEGQHARHVARGRTRPACGPSPPTLRRRQHARQHVEGACGPACTACGTECTADGPRRKTHGMRPRALSPCIDASMHGNVIGGAAAHFEWTSRRGPWHPST